MKSTHITGLFLPIFLVIFWKINYGYEVGDTFFSLNQFLFFDTAPHCINLPLFLTSYVGNMLVKLAGWMDIPPAIFLRIVPACIRALAAVVIYRTFSQDLGKYTVALGLLCGFMIEKSSFSNFYYSFVSLYGFVFMLCSVITALKRKCNIYLYISGLLYALCIFFRASNIVYGAAYLLVFLYTGNAWKHAIKHGVKQLFFAGFGLATGCIIVLWIIGGSLGFAEYSHIIENVQASSIDGHSVSSLLRKEAFSLAQGFVLLCAAACISTLYFLLTRGLSKMAWAYPTLIGAGSVFFAYLWADPYVLDFFTYKHLAYIIALAINLMAAFLVLAYLYSIFGKTSLSPHQKRILASVSVFVLTGHFGSLSSINLYINCMTFIMPVCFFAWTKIDAATCLYGKDKLCSAWRQTGFGLASALTAIALFLTLTYTVCEIKRPMPDQPGWTYQESSKIPILKGIQLTAKEKQYYELLEQELSHYANHQCSLISMSYPADNAILGMPPFLKWQGGWTWLTSPEAMQKQLSEEKDCPYILIPSHGGNEYSHRQQQKEVLFKYMEKRCYEHILTPHFHLYIPMPNPKWD